MLKPILWAGATAALILAGTGIASAGTIGTYADAEIDPGVLGSLQTDTHATSASTSITNGTYGSGTFTGSATANATYGTLKVGSSVDLTNYAPQSYTTTGGICPFTYCGPSGTGPVILPARSFASFTDTYTLTGGTGSVWVELVLGVDGTTSFSSDDTSVNSLSDSQGGVSVSDGVTDFGNWSYFGGTYTFTTDPILMTFGVADTLTITTASEIDLVDALAAANYSATGSADFSNTITLNEVDAFSDASGTTPEGTFALTTGSGTVYTTDSSTAPEPGTWVLALAAAAGLMAWRALVRTAA